MLYKKQNITTAVNKIVQPGLQVHLLGVTDVNILKDLPVHYCDSSSWAQEALFGNIVWWNPYEQEEDKLNRIRFLDKEDTGKKWDYHIGNYPYRKYFENYLENELQMSLVDVYGHNKEFNRQIANVHFFVKLQDEIRKLHRQKGIVLN